MTNTSKPNCWEVLNCGREPGGENAKKFGPCPVPGEERLNGINGGKNAGRVCWAIVGTYCHGEVQGTFAKKYADCLKCFFYKSIIKE